jgi:hypothetical protein
MSTTPQIEVEVTAMDVERLGIAMTSQTETTRLETLLTQVGVMLMEPPLM